MFNFAAFDSKQLPFQCSCIYLAKKSDLINDYIKLGSCKICCTPLSKYGVFLIGDLFWCALCLWLFVDLLHKIFLHNGLHNLMIQKPTRCRGQFARNDRRGFFIFAHNAFTYILISYSTLSMVKVKPKTWSLIRIIDQALMCCNIKLETSWHKCKERLDTC